MVPHQLKIVSKLIQGHIQTYTQRVCLGLGDPFLLYTMHFQFRKIFKFPLKNKFKQAIWVSWIVYVWNIYQYGFKVTLYGHFKHLKYALAA